jgi:hypothetical protein
MTGLAALENFEDLEPGPRHFEAGLAQVFAFQAVISEKTMRYDAPP